MLLHGTKNFTRLEIKFDFTRDVKILCCTDKNVGKITVSERFPKIFSYVFQPCKISEMIEMIYYLFHISKLLITWRNKRTSDKLFIRFSYTCCNVFRQERQYPE